MVHPAFEWLFYLEEDADWTAVLEALGFDIQIVDPDFETFDDQDGFYLYEDSREKFFEEWKPEGNGTLVATYDSEDGPYALFLTPQDEFSKMLLEWRPTGVQPELPAFTGLRETNLVHPSFDWLFELEEGEDPYLYLRAMGFGIEVDATEFDDYAEDDELREMVEEMPGHFLDQWQPEGEGVLVAKYYTEDGPMALFVKPKNEFASMLLTWQLPLKKDVR